MAKPNFGTCHLCGSIGKLSFEHVPPESAFNERRILRTTFEKVVGAKSLDILPGRVQQRGAGAFTLCEKCNSDTGSWYVPAYAEWALQAMRLLIGTAARPTLVYPYNLFPLRVLKQIICMFFSANGPNLQMRQPELVRFVLNKELRIFPAHIRIYAFYTFSNRSRSAGLTAVVRGLGTSYSNTLMFSELTFPPFGFIMTVDNSPPPFDEFCEISSFSQFAYNDWRDAISMKLPVMPIYPGFPGDYRTREQTLADIAENNRLEVPTSQRPVA